MRYRNIRGYVYTPFLKYNAYYIDNHKNQRITLSTYYKAYVTYVCVSIPYGVWNVFTTS